MKKNTGICKTHDAVLHPGNDGKILLEGRNIVNDLPEKRGIGIVYQDYALLPHLTVFQNIAYGLRNVDKKIVKHKVEEMAASLKIDHLLNRKPDSL